uniref:Glucose-1-phosphate cytidylyltransferase n=1 Tax=Eubacterium plexicaudatum ASF492 TaxID=1235802 RepID=N2AGY2_9FIRM
MKAVILAGGMQSTLHNEREGIPKPMVEIGGKPLLWHIMKHFSEYGVYEFVICGGYRVDLIKEYFMDFYIYQSDITVDLQSNAIEIHKKKTEDWKVTVVDTGVFSSTGRRVGMIQNYIQENDFLVTYGDCLSDINISELLDTHFQNGKTATVAVAKPAGRNSLLPIDREGNIRYGKEMKQENGAAWVNADCMVLRRDAFAYLQGNYDLEKQLFVKLSERKQLASYKHKGYRTAIETKRDLAVAENLWNAGIAPWTRKRCSGQV